MEATQTVQTLKNYIGGQWVASTSKQIEEVPNPATGEVIARVPLSTQEDLDHAVAVAKEAFKKSGERFLFLDALVFYSAINNY
ncbi:hypothetical protein GCM10020331_001460 [Ectobacillus funiculus]